MKVTMEISEAQTRLENFFKVYYDTKTARRYKNRPDEAIAFLREDIEAGIPSKGRLNAYAAAISDAVTLRKG